MEVGQGRGALAPGGHRRFAASDLARFTRERSALRNVKEFAGLWATKALANTRQESMNLHKNSWLGFYDEEARNRNRLLGQQRMGRTLQYLSSEANEDVSLALLEEARRIGQQYALNAKEQGLPLRATLEASIFFRDSLVETALQLPETANISSEANVRLLRRRLHEERERQVLLEGMPGRRPPPTGPERPPHHTVVHGVRSGHHAPQGPCDHLLQGLRQPAAQHPSGWSVRSRPGGR